MEIDTKNFPRLDFQILPEFVAHMGQFLNQRSLVTCLRVCQVWHQLLVLILWTKVEVIQNADHTYYTVSKTTPSYAKLYKHRMWIRELHVVMHQDIHQIFGLAPESVPPRVVPPKPKSTFFKWIVAKVFGPDFLLIGNSDAMPVQPARYALEGEYPRSHAAYVMPPESAPPPPLFCPNLTTLKVDFHIPTAEHDFGDKQAILEMI
ncbi:hypothetical protein BGZ83_007853 [Gryganskiella cystojenkinii]|nr:hypothetical protein BGZ83_007853 [Gryganskiella cystojenkinii]